MYKMSTLKPSMIPQIMAFYTESKTREKTKVDRAMWVQLKVSWLHEAQFSPSLNIRLEFLFNNVPVTLFLGIKIFKLVLSLECFEISQWETSPLLLSSRSLVELIQSVSRYAREIFRAYVCLDRWFSWSLLTWYPMILSVQGLYWKQSWGEGLGPLTHSPTLLLSLAQQVGCVVQRVMFISSDLKV